MNCTICGKPAEWVENKEVYGRNYGTSYMIWLCRPCDAYVGCHKNTKEAKGTFADRPTRQARRAAHAIIDPLWQSKKYRRDTVYRRLSEAFGYTVHVGGATKEECRDIIKTATLVFNLKTPETLF